jgi:hypothetical protein
MENAPPLRSSMENDRPGALHRYSVLNNTIAALRPEGPEVNSEGR